MSSWYCTVQTPHVRFDNYFLWEHTGVAIVLVYVTTPYVKILNRISHVQMIRICYVAKNLWIPWPFPLLPF